ncbi:MAG: protein-disulfide reductase DsbD family protein [Phycisphaerales bacterium]
MPRFTPLFLLLVALLGVVLGTPRSVCAQAPKATIRATPSQGTVHAGDKVVVAVEIEFERGWHSWPNKPVAPKELGDDFEPIPSTISGPADEKRYTVHVERIQWPEPKALESAAFSGSPITILSYGDKIIVFVPVTVAADVAPGPLSIGLTFAFQACDDSMCVMPTDITATAALTVVDAATAVAPASFSGLFGAFDQGVWQRAIPVASDTAQASMPAPGASAAKAEPGVYDFGAFGVPLEVDTRGTVGLILVALLAIVGGVLLNFMPCVLPIIPLKMLGLKEAAKTPSRYFLLGTVTSLGVVLFWLVLGLVIGLSTSFKATSLLASFWQYNIGIGIFMVAMGYGMLGTVNIGLPNWLYGLNPRHDTVPGCLFWGVLTAALSIPCTGPIMGAAAAWAADQPTWITVVVFTAIGVGMAIPYFVFSIRVEWVRWLPRAGPGSELLKQVMGLVLIAVSLWFLGNGVLIIAEEAPYVAETLHYWLAAAALLVAAGYMTLRLVRITTSPIKRLVFPAMGLLIALGMAMWARSETDDAHEAWMVRQAEREAELAALAGGTSSLNLLWKSHTPEAFEAARKAGDVVVVDYTAKWCITCKWLRKNVLNTAEVKAALKGEKVTSLEVNCTAPSAPGWDSLRALKQSGVPYLVVYAPGRDEPIFQSNAYTAGQVIEAIKQARAVAVAER